MREEGEQRTVTKPQAILGEWGPDLPVVHHQQHLFIPEGDDNDSSTLEELPAWITLFHSMTSLPFNPIPWQIFLSISFFYS